MTLLRSPALLGLRRLVALGLALGTLPACLDDETGGRTSTPPLVTIERADGSIDPRGQAVLSDQPATNEVSGYLFLDLDDEEHERTGDGWVLQASIDPEAVTSGARLVMPIVPSVVEDGARRPALPAFGTATVRHEPLDGEAGADATGGTLTLTIDFCAGTIEGSVDVTPERLGATFEGSASIAESLDDFCTR